jgi:hypothetical protein
VQHTTCNVCNSVEVMRLDPNSMCLGTAPVSGGQQDAGLKQQAGGLLLTLLACTGPHLQQCVSRPPCSSNLHG